jgi:hypothetical protein
MATFSLGYLYQKVKKTYFILLPQFNPNLLLNILTNKIKQKNSYPSCNYAMNPLVAVMMKVTLMFGSSNSDWVAVELVYLHLL